MVCINLPNNTVFDDKHRGGRMFTYLDEKREYYKIYFAGGQLRFNDKVLFDSPGIVIVSTE